MDDMQSSVAEPEKQEAQVEEPAEVETEPAEPAEAEVLPPDEEAASIEVRIAELEQELADERARALRVLADFQNYRRRTEEQRLETAAYVVQEFVAGLLPVLDNFERALEAAKANHSFEGLVSGVEMILRQMQELLAKYGVEPIEAVGQPFDPQLHDAVMRVHDPEKPDNTVVEELTRGYRMKDRVIRPAAVKVATRE